MKRSMNFRILKALLRKEVELLRRNPLIPKVMLVMPIMVMLIIPLVTNMDVKNVGVVVVDNDRTELSRRIWSDIDAAEQMAVKEVVTTYSEAMESIRDGEADVIVDIPRHFTRDLITGTPEIDISANGVNATKGMLGSQYAGQSVAGTLKAYRAEEGMPIPDANISAVYKYNRTLNFKNFMIPGLMVVLIIIICGFLPAINIVDEKQTGTIEAMNVTPVSKMTFVLSKLIPFWIAGIVIVTIGMTIGWAVYGLVPQGSIWGVYLATLLFSLVMSGLGVFISNKSATIMQSIFLMFAFIMIFQLMAGLFTPISSMPQWAQYITYLVPPRYFIEIMRSIYLKGTTIAELMPQFGALTAFAIAMFLLAAVTYKNKTENSWFLTLAIM